MIKCLRWLLLCHLICATPSGFSDTPKQDSWRGQVADLDESRLAQEVARHRTVVRDRPKDKVARDGLADASVTMALGSEVDHAMADNRSAERKLNYIRKSLSDTLWRVQNRASKDDVDALVALGVFRAHGVVVDVDYELACDAWYRAAELQNSLAQYRAALCSAETDERLSIKYMRGAADHGHPAAQQSLAEICLNLDPPDTACAARWASSAALQGRVPAQGLVGWLHFSGQKTGLTDSQALAFLEAAAQTGDTTAINNVGQVLESGAAGEARKPEAVDWYRKAATEGYPPAQYNLGRLYVVGLGVEPNIGQARLWLTLAEDGGVVQAGELVDWLVQQED